jgi:hypothetical protein
MAVKMDDLVISADLPEPREEMPVFTVRSASLKERQGAIDLLGKRLDLGELATAEIEESLYFVGKAGEVQYYRPSGALWARNAAAGRAFDSEVRPWQDLEKAGEKDQKLVLPAPAAKELAEQARAVMEEGGLSSKHAFLAGVELEQVAVLNPEGEEEGPQAGEAIARFLYRLEEVLVDGGGAKSYFYFNPGDRGAAMVGAFHAWRDVVDARAVTVPKPEAMLDVALAEDPELGLYLERGQKVELRAIDLVYYALPAFMHQELVFPALRVVGSVAVEGEKDGLGFEFARYFHAVPSEAYAHADFYATYLAAPL